MAWSQRFGYSCFSEVKTQVLREQIGLQRRKRPECALAQSGSDMEARQEDGRSDTSPYIGHVDTAWIPGSQTPLSDLLKRVSAPRGWPCLGQMPSLWQDQPGPEVLEKERGSGCLLLQLKHHALSFKELRPALQSLGKTGISPKTQLSLFYFNPSTFM